MKNMLKKIEKSREELLYEQRIALEHANKFAKLSATKTKQLITKLMELEFIKESHAYKLADLLPSREDDIKTIFAKERVTLKEADIKTVLDIISSVVNE